MNRMTDRIAFAFLLGCLSHGMADAQDTVRQWDACLETPVRACVLDEALALALPVDGRWRAAALGRIAEAWAKAGDIDQALRVATVVTGSSRNVALVTVAGALSKAGRFEEALQLTYALQDRLRQAEALHTIAKAQAESGAAAAADTFDQALQSAQSVRIEWGSPGEAVVPTPEQQLDRLLRDMAIERADAGHIMQALQIARSIRYDPTYRAEALSAVAAAQANAGMASEATLDEALETVLRAHSPPEPWPSYRAAGFGQLSWDGQIYVKMLCGVAKAQARSGLAEKAATTLDEALRVVTTMRDSPAFKRDQLTAVVLTDIAECQRVRRG
jgi:hypothetical protein